MLSFAFLITRAQTTNEPFNQQVVFTKSHCQLVILWCDVDKLRFGGWLDLSSNPDSVLKLHGPEQRLVLSGPPRSLSVKWVLKPSLGGCVNWTGDCKKSTEPDTEDHLERIWELGSRP